MADTTEQNKDRELLIMFIKWLSMLEGLGYTEKGTKFYVDKFLEQKANIKTIERCDCKHSGSCRYEIVILETKELCRHKE